MAAELAEVASDPLSYLRVLRMSGMGLRVGLQVGTCPALVTQPPVCVRPAFSVGGGRPEHRAPLGKAGGETVGTVAGTTGSAGVEGDWCPVIPLIEQGPGDGRMKP